MSEGILSLNTHYHFCIIVLDRRIYHLDFFFQIGLIIYKIFTFVNTHSTGNV